MEENLTKSPRRQPLQITDTLQEAWHLLKGSKGPIWAIAILMIIVGMVVTIILTRISHFPDMQFPDYYQYLLVPLVNSLFIAPFLGGTIMTAVKRARGEPVSAKSGYGYFRKSGSLILTLLIITFLVNIIKYIVHLPAVMVAFQSHFAWLEILANIISVLVYTFTLFAIPLVIDQNRKPFDALRQSVRLVKTHWLKVLICLIIVYLVFLITILPLIIVPMLYNAFFMQLVGLAISILLEIWALPFYFLVVGVLYHHMADSAEIPAPIRPTENLAQPPQ